jgi:hypothetical protein
MSLTEQHLCRLTSIVGDPEPCPEDRCPFWEPGGAVLSGRCGFEQVQFEDNADLAGFLLRIRRALEQARAGEEDQEVRVVRGGTLVLPDLSALGTRFAVDVAVTLGAIGPALALGAATLRRRTS